MALAAKLFAIAVGVVHCVVLDDGNLDNGIRCNDGNLRPVLTGPASQQDSMPARRCRGGLCAEDNTAPVRNYSAMVSLLAKSKRTLDLVFLQLRDTEGALVLSIATGMALLTLAANLHPAFSQSGYAIAFACAMNSVCMSNGVHYANNKAGLPFGFLALARTTCLTFGSFILGKLQKEPVTLWPAGAHVRTKILLRATFGFTSVIVLFFALTSAPVLLCQAVFYSNSFWSTLVSYFFLGESLRRADVLAMCVGMLSVLVMIHSGATHVSPSASAVGGVAGGIGLALVAAVFDGCAASVNRSCRGHVHHITLMLAQASFGFLVCILGATLFPTRFLVWPLSPVQCRITISIALSSFMVQLGINQCYMLSKTGPIQVFVNAMVVVPQIGVDTAMGYQHRASTWFGLMLLGLYLLLSWRAARSTPQKDASQAAQPLPIASNKLCSTLSANRATFPALPCRYATQGTQA